MTISNSTKFDSNTTDANPLSMDGYVLNRLVKYVVVTFLVVAGSFLATGNLFAAVTPDFAELYKKSSGSVATVKTLSIGPNGQTQQGIGSAILVAEDELLTAAHVVDGVSKMKVLFKDGVEIEATVVASIQSSDIALIRLVEPNTTAPIATLADSDETPVGSPVYVIGAPFGIAQTLSIGHLSGRLNRGEMAGGAPIEFLQTDTAINTGNSGGPMFNIDGEVIGVVSFIMTKSGGFDGIGFATSSNTAQEALLNSSGILAGFEGVMLTDEMASVLNIPQAGLLVQRVSAGTVAGKAGLKAGTIPATINGQSLLLGGDVILEINGLICERPHDFQLVQESTVALEEGDTYAIKVFRNGETVDLIAGAPLKQGPLTAGH